MKFQNDWREHSKAEKLILAIVLAIMVLVVLSWALDGFAASNHGITHRGFYSETKSQFSQENNDSIRIWDL